MQRQKRRQPFFRFVLARSDWAPASRKHRAKVRPYVSHDTCYCSYRNVTDARVLPKTRAIYAKYLAGETRINVNGNASEICRNYFDPDCQRDARETTVGELAAVIGYADQPFVEQELTAWHDELCAFGLGNFNVFDMLYWEQRLGNWGAQYPSEQDIAVEEYSPFNCRSLITTLLSCPRELRSAPDYAVYRKLIGHMWPEALSVPINPEPSVPINPEPRDRPVISVDVSALKERIRPFVPSPVIEAVELVRRHERH